MKPDQMTVKAVKFAAINNIELMSGHFNDEHCRSEREQELLADFTDAIQGIVASIDLINFEEVEG